MVTSRGTRVPWRSVVAIGVLLSFASGTAARAGAPPRLCALTSDAQGRLFALEEDGGLLRVESDGAELVQMIPRFGAFEPVDLAVATIDGESRILVLTFWPQAGTRGEPRIFSYAENGESRDKWYFERGGLFSGIAVTADGTRAFAVRGNSAEVLQLDLARSKGDFSGGERVALLPRTRALSVIALDEAASRAYVAAPYDGRIFTIHLTSGRVEETAEGVGQVFAMIVDRGRQRLLAADYASGAIWWRSLADPDPGMARLDAGRALEEPVGLAVGPDGSLWVAERAGRVSRVD